MTTPSQAHAPSVTLAQQALEVYDQKGEFAMLPFAMAHCRPKDEADDDHSDWTERGYLLLDDGSDITHLGGCYHFGWHSRETGFETHVQRPSAMPDDGRPEPTSPTPRPVIAWPHLYNVWESFMDIVWESVMDIVQYRASNDEGDRIITEPDVSYRLAPSLNNAIRQAIAKAETGGYIDKYADNIARDIADKTIELIQPHELAALVEHSKRVPETNE